MHFLATGGLYVVVVIGGTVCDASSKSSATALAFNVSLTGGPPFISRYKLNFSKLDIIIGSVSFSLYRYASNYSIFLDV